MNDLVIFICGFAAGVVLTIALSVSAIEMYRHYKEGN